MARYAAGGKAIANNAEKAKAPNVFFVSIFTEEIR